MESTVQERLMSFIRHKQVSVNRFEKICGFSTGYIHNMRKSMQPDKIKSIAHNFPDLNTEWLITGEGVMIKGSSSENPSVDSLSPSPLLIPVVPTEAQAGHLSDFTNAVQDYECEKMISPVRDATLAMAVYGDSMFPEYPSGSRILLKKINEKAFIEWGKVYVLDTENGAVIKEIHHCDDENYIECVSQNPDPKYAPFKVAKSSIFGWYKVIMVLSYK